MTDEKVLPILQTQIKRRMDSIEQYKKGGRDDLAQNEQKEIDIINGYLPKQLSMDELEAEIKEVIAGLGEGTNIGTVMKAAYTGACTAERFNFRRMIVSLIFEHQ